MLQFHSPYLYAGNNPIRFIDPNGMYAGEMSAQDIVSLIDRQSERRHRGDLIDQEMELMSARHDDDKRVINNGPTVIAEGGQGDSSGKGDPPSSNGNTTGFVKDLTNLISNAFVDLFFNKGIIGDDENKVVLSPKEVIPYVSISVGKQTNERIFGQNIPASFYGTLMWTPDAIYGTVGSDLSLGQSAFNLPLNTSISMSFGLIVGPKDGITGPGFGYSGGSILGFERGNSIITDGLKLKSVGNTNSYGINIGHQKIYGSGNISYTWKLLDL